LNPTKHNLYCKALLIAAITIIAFSGPAWASQVTEHGITINLFDEIIEIEEEKDAFLPSYRTDPGAIRALAAKADRAGTVILTRPQWRPGPFRLEIACSWVYSPIKPIE